MAHYLIELCKRMTNEEKLEYIKESQAFTMRNRLWDKPELSLEELKALDDNCWREFSQTLLPRIPKVLYRYRPFNEHSLDELKNGYAWFSNPADFDDGTDSALNTDIESEIKEIDKSPSEMLSSLAHAIIIPQYRSIAGHDPDKERLKNLVELWLDGKLNIDTIKHVIANANPEVSPEPPEEVLARLNESKATQFIEKTLRAFLEFYMSINERIRSNLLCLCLAEEHDNDVMWAKYAGERSGFCVGYEIATTSFLGQRALMMLSPVYYGEKKPLRFFDILIDGINAHENDQINGWTTKTYEDMHVASLTKDPKWSFQKEWRVVFSPEAGNNKQPFPFVKSIYIGEKMEKDHRQELIALAKEKGWALFERKLNKSGSKIIYQSVEF